MSEILTAGTLKFTEADCPTRAGEVLNRLEEIYDIPTPYVGMRVYDKQTQKSYIITSLASEIVGGKEVPTTVLDFVEENYMTAEEAQKLKNVSNLFLIPEGVEGDVNKFVYVGKFTNLNDAYARCAQIGRENPTLSMMKFDIVSGNIYDSLFILQTYNRNDSIVTQFLLYGEGHKHTCKIRHIVTNGQVDEWQDIQLYTSYSYENNALYGYKYGKGGGVNKVKLFTIPTATTESAGVMSANDKQKLEASAESFDFFAEKDKVGFEASANSGNLSYAYIPVATAENAGVMTAEDKQKLEAAGNGATKVTWGSASNMNDYRTAGVYEIYGERTRLDDNLPILNASPGHSIAARLTVVDSSLQKADGSAPTEIHLTQFLMLDNRVGPSADMYMRTYTQDNGQTNNGAGEWGLWRKFQGVVETYLNSDTRSINVHGDYISDYQGLNQMIDNGIYTGIYTDDTNLMYPSFLETFTLIVINNYAVADQDSRLKRTISQLKYAVDAITNQATVKQRTKTDGGVWSDWQEIGGGNNEVDITDAVKAYGLPALVAQGLAKEGVTYKVVCDIGDVPTLDTENKLKYYLQSLSYENFDDRTEIFIRKIKGCLFLDICILGDTGKYFKCVISRLNSSIEKVEISEDMTTL